MTHNTSVLHILTYKHRNAIEALLNKSKHQYMFDQVFWHRSRRITIGFVPTSILWFICICLLYVALIHHIRYPLNLRICHKISHE